MHFSDNDETTSRSLLERAGLEMEIDQDDEDARFLWVVARKPI
jgi:hypothetical protein